MASFYVQFSKILEIRNFLFRKYSPKLTRNYEHPIFHEKGDHQTEQNVQLKPQWEISQSAT